MVVFILFLGLFSLGAGTLAVSASLERNAHHEHRAHIHGEGRATVALVERTLEITIAAPAESLLGFEHMPRNAAEERAVQDFKRRIKDTSQLFTFSASAMCQLEHQAARMPFEHSEHNSQALHSDIEVEYRFHCDGAEKIDIVEFMVFKRFPRLKTLEVEYVTDTSQGKMKMSEREFQLSFSN